jgi:outer membrane protein OmpA-like peptidoglycan-associated protein
MSFNLNKNDGPNNPSKKTSFDLSKNDPQTPDADPAGSNNANTAEPGGQGTSNRKWLYILIALFIMGGAGWYFTREIGDTQPTADSGKTSTDSSAQTAVAVKDSDVISASPAASQSVSTADSITKPNAGPTQPSAIDPESGVASSAETAAKTETAENNPVQTASRVAASFTSGSSRPGNTGSSIPALIREKLKSSPNLTINVLGYASSEGSPEINRQISQARADAYKKLLILKGIAETHINALGKGVENPIASNETEAGRKKNRRVEVSW